MNLCETCRWWSCSADKPDMGQCGLYGHFTNFLPELRVRVPGDTSSYMYTAKDFGCVQWEKKL